MRRLFFIFIMTVSLSGHAKMVNPVTDVCWECLFPVSLSGVNVTPGNQDFSSPGSPVCACAGLPPKIGVPLSFWEPARLVEVTRDAYKLISFGGLTIGPSSIKNRGSVRKSSGYYEQSSFAHVHVISYPLLEVLGLLEDFVCGECGSFELSYMSELDPLWYDDSLSLIMHPEAALFSTPLAHVTCIADCTASSFQLPQDVFFWCAGCAGSLYPFTGRVSHYVGPLQEASLLMQRSLAKLHRSGMMKGYGPSDYCEPAYQPYLPKTQYKMQLAYPIAQSQGPCHALGKTDLLWGAGKSYPGEGEDFVFVLWSKKQCCLDAAKPALSGVAI